MVRGFSHSISLPLSPKHKANKKASHHVRSASLPCHSQPLISNLEEQIHAVRSLAANPDEATSTSVEAILSQIEALQTSVEDFLNLAQTKKTLRVSKSTIFLLENYLLLADIYGSFISTIVNLKQHQSEVQSAIRRSDKVSLTTSLRSQRHVEKEISQLASSLKSVNKYKSVGLPLNANEAEIVGILKDAISATSAGSVVALNGVVAMSASVSSTKSSSYLQMFKKFSTSNSSIMCRALEEERLEEFEICVGNVEELSKEVFRSFINSRVSLLNISSSSL